MVWAVLIVLELSLSSRIISVSKYIYSVVTGMEITLIRLTDTPVWVQEDLPAQSARAG